MILKGDCIKVMKAMKPNSIDAICTDPPYGLEFMGKEWDKLWDKREFGIDEYSKKSYTCSDGSTRKTNPVSRKLSNPNYKAGIEAQLWHTQWLTEAYRVLKPGGSMLVMGGTRTSHRLACAIEDSGFIIKDTLMWIYGSGFPKAQDLGKMIDKRGGKDISWFIDYVLKVAKERDISKKELTNLFLSKNGKPTGWLYNKSSHIQGLTVEQFNKIRDFLQLPFSNLEEAKREIVGKSTNKIHLENLGQAGYKDKFDISLASTDLAKHWDGFKVGGIKPAYEPIIWAVKPPEGSYVDNVLKWGVGAVNVDECRVEAPEGLAKGGCTKYGGVFGNDGKVNNPEGNPKGRFPANIILSHHPSCRQVGLKRIKGAWSNKGIVKNKRIFNANLGQNIPVNKDKYYDADGYETVESWDCHPDCAVRMLNEQSGERQSKWGKNAPDKLSGNINYVGKKRASQQQFRGDSGGASRFFYCAKASGAERNMGLEEMEEKFGNPNLISSKMVKRGHPEPEINKPTWSENKEARKVKNNHPTVKPIKLFEWLIQLVTREGQIILDPFIGSGTTGIAAHNIGRKCVGIEKEPEYLEIAKRRTAYWRSRPRQLEII